jgi:hypothetical protein
MPQRRVGPPAVPDGRRRLTGTGHV